MKSYSSLSTVATFRTRLVRRRMSQTTSRCPWLAARSNVVVTAESCPYRSVLFISSFNAPLLSLIYSLVISSSSHNDVVTCWVVVLLLLEFTFGFVSERLSSSTVVDSQLLNSFHEVDTSTGVTLVRSYHAVSHHHQPLHPSSSTFFIPSSSSSDLPTLLTDSVVSIPRSADFSEQHCKEVFGSSTSVIHATFRISSWTPVARLMVFDDDDNCECVLWVRESLELVRIPRRLAILAVSLAVTDETGQQKPHRSIPSSRSRRQLDCLRRRQPTLPNL